MSIETIVYRADSAEIIAACQEHEAAHRAVTKAQWAFVREQGAISYRPGYLGIATLIFDREKIPAAWKPHKRQGNDLPAGRVDCVPDRRKAEGRRLAKLLQDGANGLKGAPSIRRPDIGPLMEAIGREGGGYVFDGRYLDDPRMIAVKHPTPVYLIILPFAGGETWQPPAGLTELKRSEYHRYIEDHNAGVKAAA